MDEENLRLFEMTQTTDIELDSQDKTLFKINEKIDKKMNEKGAFEAELIATILRNDVSLKILPRQIYSAIFEGKVMIHIDTTKKEEYIKYNPGMEESMTKIWNKVFLNEDFSRTIRDLFMMKEVPRVMLASQDVFNPKGLRDKIGKWIKTKTAFDFAVFAVIVNHEISGKILYNRTYEVLQGEKLELFMHVLPEENKIVFVQTTDDAIVEHWKGILAKDYPGITIYKKEKNNVTMDAQEKD